jgi:uncharacterized OB-fold protein
VIAEAAEAPPTGERARFDLEAARLIGSRCPGCGTTAWPARAVCHSCGQARVDIVPLAPTGTLLTYTTVWVPRPGLEPPFVLGQVKIDDGPIIFCHVRGLGEELVVPHPVEIVMADSADSVPPFWFEPAGRSKGEG